MIMLEDIKKNKIDFKIKWIKFLMDFRVIDYDSIGARYKENILTRKNS